MEDNLLFRTFLKDFCDWSIGRWHCWRAGSGDSGPPFRMALLNLTLTLTLILTLTLYRRNGGPSEWLSDTGSNREPQRITEQNFRYVARNLSHSATFTCMPLAV